MILGNFDAKKYPKRLRSVDSDTLNSPSPISLIVDFKYLKSLNFPLSTNSTKNSIKVEYAPCWGTKKSKVKTISKLAPSAVYSISTKPFTRLIVIEGNEPPPKGMFKVYSRY